MNTQNANPRMIKKLEYLQAKQQKTFFKKIDQMSDQLEGIVDKVIKRKVQEQIEKAIKPLQEDINKLKRKAS